ncbi:MAG: hypothetical protein K6343_02205 [Caldisericaceae bacterium]
MNLQNNFILEVENFSLDKTLNCGQTFRFFKNEEYYIYPYKDSVLKLKEKNRNILEVEVYGEYLSKDEVKEIFGLNHDVKKINEKILNIAPNLEEPVSFSNGIRIMKMQPYEATISFIFSIQSQIPVIQKRLNKLSTIVGRKITIDGIDYYLFPKFEDLITLTYEHIKSLNLGFREKFFLNLIKNYKSTDFEVLKDKTYEEKKKFLMSILGVGEKVSECILLFGYGELSAFPVDTWIIKGLKKFFNVEGSTKKLTEFGHKKFDSVSGYAQQYIYYFMRNFWDS